MNEMKIETALEVDGDSCRPMLFGHFLDRDLPSQKPALDDENVRRTSRAMGCVDEF